MKVLRTVDPFASITSMTKCALPPNPVMSPGVVYVAAVDRVADWTVPTHPPVAKGVASLVGLLIQALVRAAESVTA